MRKTRLFTPGPTPLMPAAQLAASKPIVHHRTEEFRDLFLATRKNLQEIFKTTGDGALAEFGSAVDAVQCAVEIQRTLAERNADLPEDVRIVLRIGISLGDVIVEGEDLYGNGSTSPHA